MLSCKKESSITQPENSNQLLTKVIRTGEFGGGTFSIDYKYNSAGKLIKEGNKTYERDDQQRIVRILDPGTGSNRGDIQVYYNGYAPNEVAYTFCKMMTGDATDSVVYLHDDHGRLIKTMSYISYFANQYIPDTTLFYEFCTFSYNMDGNMAQMDDYKINYDGRVVHCGQYFFANYDRGINPLYTGDEVRMVDFSCGGILNSTRGVLNNSMNNFTSTINNFTSTGSYTKLFEYRADGKPRTCLIQENGVNLFRLVYEYK
jgi:hypothetical protein